MNKRIPILFAWIITLSVSILPDILLNEVFKINPPWLVWGKIGLLIIALGITLSVSTLRQLWKYALVLLVLLFSEWFFNTILGKTAFWQSRFGSTAFIPSLFSLQLLRLLIAFIVLSLSLVLWKHPGAFLMVKGDLRASAAPIPLLMAKPTLWNKLGWILAACISGGTLVFLLLAGMPSWGDLQGLIRFLPAIIGLALMNSFSEESSYRAAPLATLQDTVGPQQSLLMTAIFFGMGHYYGVPYGIIGVIMASLLGWLLGKSMLETRGFAWAWFIHFIQDVLIFSFMTIGAVVAGGG